MRVFVTVFVSLAATTLLDDAVTTEANAVDVFAEQNNDGIRDIRSVRADGPYMVNYAASYGGSKRKSSSSSSSSTDDCSKCSQDSCPDTTGDLLQLFSSGVSLSFLFAMVAQGMATPTNPVPVMPNPMPQPPGRRNYFDTDGNGIASFLSNLPHLLSTEVGPLAVDYLGVYVRSQRNPECVRRWICEATRKSLKHGGVRASLTSLSSVAFSWLMNNIMPFLENMDAEDTFDCGILAPNCQKPLEDFFKDNTL